MIVESIIPDLLFAHIGSFDKNMKIAYPNVSFTPPNETYLEVRFLPNTNRNPFIGNDDQTHYIGIFQITVISASNIGEIKPREIASRIVDHFRKGMRLQKDDVVLTVYSKPSIASSIQDANRYQIPISVQYQCIHK